jgi:hypothetical protein
LHVELKSDGDTEDLDAMMDGQSHRARLREAVHNSGGQEYDPRGNGDTSRQPPASNNTGGGTASRGGRGGGVAGTRSRSTITSLGWSVMFPKLSRPNGTLTTYISPTTHRGASNRPLDPAIDPTDPRSKYRFGRRDGRASRGSHQDSRSRVRGNTTSGRSLGWGGTGQVVRGTIIGTRAQVSATSTRLPQGRRLAPNSRWATASLATNPTPNEPVRIEPGPARRVPSSLQDSSGYDMLLSPTAFLATIAKTKDREIFNKMVSSESNPAPASKAVEIAAKPSKNVEKTSNDLAQSTPRPALPPKEAEISKLAAEKPAPVCKANEVKEMTRDTIKNVESERLKPEESMPDDITPPKAIPSKATYQKPKVGKPTEFVKLTPEQDEGQRCWPSSFSKSGPSFNEISGWTDGLSPPGMSNFSGSSERTPVIALADLIEEGNAKETNKSLPVAQEAKAAVVDLGISDIVTSAPNLRNSVDEDLLGLRTDEAGQQPVGDHGGSTYILQKTQAPGAAADLMDLDFGSISQDSLIPSLPGPSPKPKREPKAEADTKPAEPAIAPFDLPPYVEVGGIPYFREGQRPPANPPATAIGDVAMIALATAPPATDRVGTGSENTTGVPSLGLHNEHLFGDHKLARKTQGNLMKPPIDSIWSTPPVAMAKRQARTGSLVRVDQKQTLEGPLEANTAVDPRPHAIGDRNLPGRSQGVRPQDMPSISSRFPSQEGGCNTRGSTHCPQGQSMPVEANPWGATCTAVSTTPKSSNLAESRLAKLAARLITRSSDSTTEGRPSIWSAETVSSSQSRESIFCHAQVQNSPRSHFSPSTSEDVVISSAHQIRRTAEQLSLSVRSTSLEDANLAESSQPTPMQENFEGRMVRLMNSQGSRGMTKFAGGDVTTESRGLLSSAKHTRGSPRSQGTLGKHRANLDISKRAAKDAATYSMTAGCSPKLTTLSHQVPSFKQSDISVQHPEDRIMAEAQGTPPDPRLALLLADVAAQPAAPSSPEITRSTTTSLLIATGPTGYTSPTTQSMVSGRNMTAEPRIRVVNQASALGESKRPGVAQRGKGKFLYRSTDNSESSGDESKL